MGDGRWEMGVRSKDDFRFFIESLPVSPSPSPPRPLVSQLPSPISIATQTKIGEYLIPLDICD